MIWDSPVRSVAPEVLDQPEQKFIIRTHLIARRDGLVLPGDAPCLRREPKFHIKLPRRSVVSVKTDAHLNWQNLDC